MKTHLSNPELDVEMLCKEMGVSRAKLYRKVKAITNLSPAELIRNIRLECAAEMLRTSQQTATEIPIKQDLAVIIILVIILRERQFTGHGNSLQRLLDLMPTDFTHLFM